MIILKRTKKRVGIITFHRSYNYGSVLQAYALQTYISERITQCKVIDYRLDSDFKHYKLFRTELYRKQWKPFLSDCFYFRKNYKRKKNFEHFCDKYLKLTNQSFHTGDDLTVLNSDFDTYICGSDQIWNVHCTGKVIPDFFLSFTGQEKKKIAYAPSIADRSITTEEMQEAKKYLQRFVAVSVREGTTARIIQPLCKKKVEVVLDPTLLLNKRNYEKLIEDSTLNTRSPYIFVYMLEGNCELISYAKELSEKKGMRIKYISKKNIFGTWKADNLYGTSPSDFLKLIRDARYIVTNSFHATVFSILFEKQFCTFTTKDSGSRMVDLLEQLNINNRLYGCGFGIDQVIDYITVKSKLDNLRIPSYKFLEENL